MQQEDNNNNLSLQQTLSQNNFLVSCTNNNQQQQQNANFMPNVGVGGNANQLTANAETAALLALAASVTANANNISQQQNQRQHHQQQQQQQQQQQHFSNNPNRYSIAANPLLAEKLLSPANINDLDSLSLVTGNRNGRPPDIKGQCDIFSTMRACK